ncbi:hypothetical protein VTN00DRAFT_1425 [Thermoascus crustaceus]|uniref:uncharacterized protein n=1 Tax=Thermoascus crustaceus TaxID=5088 RepID=UPI0037437F4F
MKLFTTGKMGLGIKNTGAGERDKKIQEDWAWCPILSEWFPESDTRAGHLFAYMHGQDTMDAIFGKTQPPELFSPRNELILAKYVEDVFDLGKIVIVPDLPNRPTTVELLAWLKQEPWEWRDLDNKRLEFLTPFRPAARYLYFRYCMQVLRRAWQQTQTVVPAIVSFETDVNPEDKLKGELTLPGLRFEILPLEPGETVIDE